MNDYQKDDQGGAQNGSSYHFTTAAREATSKDKSCAPRDRSAPRVDKAATEGAGGGSSDSRGFPFKETPCTRTTFFVNADWRMGSTLATATTIVGQMYVERLEPLSKRQPHPIIFVHGDFHTGNVWLAKPDGKPGWASFFLRRGYEVYIVDLPPSGRSNFLTGAHFTHRELSNAAHSISASFVESELTAPGKGGPSGLRSYLARHPRAVYHDKWPGTGRRGDPIFTNYCASLVTLNLGRFERQSLAQNALQVLLRKIGKSFFVGEGTGATMAWLAADVEPDLVGAVVAVEPAGPPFGTAVPKKTNPRVYSDFMERDVSLRSYGIADIPLTFDPPVEDVAGIDTEANDPLGVVAVFRPDRRASCFLQCPVETESLRFIDSESPQDNERRSSVRQLVQLQKVRHVIVTAHASSHFMYDWATAAFMRQAGVTVDRIKLEDLKIYGNGHLMFLETNSDTIADVVEGWIQQTVVPGGPLQVAAKFTDAPKSSKVENPFGNPSGTEMV